MRLQDEQVSEQTLNWGVSNFDRHVECSAESVEEANMTFSHLKKTIRFEMIFETETVRI